VLDATEARQSTAAGAPPVAHDDGASAFCRAQ